MDEKLTITELACNERTTFELCVLPNGKALVTVSDPHGETCALLPWEDVVQVFEKVQQRLDAAGLKGAREYLDRLESTLDM